MSRSCSPLPELPPWSLERRDPVRTFGGKKWPGPVARGTGLAWVRFLRDPGGVAGASAGRTSPPAPARRRSPPAAPPPAGRHDHATGAGFRRSPARARDFPKTLLPLLEGTGPRTSRVHDLSRPSRRRSPRADFRDPFADRHDPGRPHLDLRAVLVDLDVGREDVPVAPGTGGRLRDPRDLWRASQPGEGRRRAASLDIAPRYFWWGWRPPASRTRLPA